MKIVIIAEGKTEQNFLPFVRDFVNRRLTDPTNKPKIHGAPQNGGLHEATLKKLVDNWLGGSQPADAVIALVDVHSQFENAADAKAQLRQWVGENPKFYPHAAQYDIEAWLIPFWKKIQDITGNKKNAPTGSPELIRHNGKSAVYLLEEIFMSGTR